MDDPVHDMKALHQAVATAREGTPTDLLAALNTLRLLRDTLNAWEPELITAARLSGTSWAALAPALGVTSRQAAERRYLRLQPTTTGETTGEARIDAQRDRRAGDRAVADWARRNAATLRKLASHASTTVPDTDTASRLDEALAHHDPTTLLAPLAAAHPHLTPGALAEQIDAITDHTTTLRREAGEQRRLRRG
ncbi:MAG: HSP18 transcriptional regulator [Saccharothrix sp.]|nr:HSP18 transcriptional regulator [Saccharothrix sp.]